MPTRWLVPHVREPGRHTNEAREIRTISKHPHASVDSLGIVQGQFGKTGKRRGQCADPVGGHLRTHEIDLAEIGQFGQGGDSPVANACAIEGQIEQPFHPGDRFKRGIGNLFHSPKIEVLDGSWRKRRQEIQVFIPDVGRGGELHHHVLLYGYAALGRPKLLPRLGEIPGANMNGAGGGLSGENQDSLRGNRSPGALRVLIADEGFSLKGPPR